MLLLIDHCLQLALLFSYNLSVSVCFPLTPYCVDDQAHHPLDRLLTANTFTPNNGTSFAHLLTLISCLRSSRAAHAQQPLSLLPSPRTVLFKTHAVKSAKHSRFPVTHGTGLRAPNSHLLCSVMLLDKRFARPRADLHHRPKSNWSCVRRQGHDSRDRFP